MFGGGWMRQKRKLPTTTTTNDMNIQMRLPSLLMISMQLFSIKALTWKKANDEKYATTTKNKKKWLI